MCIIDKKDKDCIKAMCTKILSTQPTTIQISNINIKHKYSVIFKITVHAYVWE